VLGEGPSYDGCRHTWIEVPLWKARLVPHQEQGVTTSVGMDNERSRGCHVAVREMFHL
jgi:hypothetical protein